MRLSVGSIAVVVAGCACLGAAAATGGCIIAPPADLPPEVLHRPTILHGSVVPQPPVLNDWTATLPFVVPVQLVDPSQSFHWDVFVDYNNDPTTRPVQERTVTPTPATVNGGVFRVEFPLDPANFDLCLSHRIEMLVAHNWEQLMSSNGQAGPAFHTPDTAGFDSVSWLYPGPAGPNGCFSFDAGGSLPADGSPDMLPLSPAEGGNQ